ncbi:hypothetical protein NDU88_000003 [Pleurodeles waltl]|uniref:Uncharacterized protein n=1 Tax=Pleurodeles waltl TaxID=8319 RepID=A0AAV7KNE2_PLEWA|nr:hypothetical protein NDU88_000003 [Pleurodeles waltl]
MGVKRKLKELEYTYMLLFPAKLKVLHAGRSHFFQTPKAICDWLELGDGGGTPGSQSRGVCEQLAKMGSIQSALRRTSRRRRATRGTKVIVRSDGTLTLDRRHREREEARLLDGRPLKLLEEAKALLKHNSIQKKLDQELVQQEDTLNALQRLINNGDALENESRGDIGALWSRLASYICKDFQQRLHREGDRSGCLLAWLLRRECPTPIILSLRGPTGDRILGQTRVNVHLREHLEAIYSSPWCDVGSQTREYLDGLWLPRLTDAQAAELEAEFSLEDLQGALGDMASGRAPGLDGLPVEFYHAYSATLLPRLLEILQESGEGGLLPQQMREALIVMLPKTGRDPADPSSYRPLSM